MIGFEDVVFSALGVQQLEELFPRYLPLPVEAGVARVPGVQALRRADTGAVARQRGQLVLHQGAVHPNLVQHGVVTEQPGFGVQLHAELHVRTAQTARTIDGRLGSGENLFVTVDATGTGAENAGVGFTGFGGLRRVEEDVALGDGIALDFERDEARVVIVGVVPVLGGKGVTVGTHQGVFAHPVTMLTFPCREAAKVEVGKIAVFCDGGGGKCSEGNARAEQAKWQFHGRFPSRYFG